MTRTASQNELRSLVARPQGVRWTALLGTAPGRRPPAYRLAHDVTMNERQAGAALGRGLAVGAA